MVLTSSSMHNSKKRCDRLLINNGPASFLSFFSIGCEIWAFEADWSGHNNRHRSDMNRNRVFPLTLVYKYAVYGALPEEVGDGGAFSSVTLQQLRRCCLTEGLGGQMQVHGNPTRSSDFAFTLVWVI